MLCYTKLYNAGAIIETKKPISYSKTERNVKIPEALEAHGERERERELTCWILLALQ